MDHAVRPRQAPQGRGSKGISLNAVNGWRGPGAIGIAVAHFGIATDFFVVRDLEPAALLVDLFFVLSGIVIAQVYTTKLSRPSAVPEYLVRRAGRIWPVQAFTLAILVTYELVKLFLQTFAGKHFSSPPFSPDGLDTVPAIFTNLFLVQSLGMHDRETWNFPSWSLSVEFFTYSLFALLCLLPALPRRMLALGGVVASLLVLALIAPYHMRSTFDYGVFRCIAGFFAGTLCHDALVRWRVPKWHAPTLVEVATIVLFGIWISHAPNNPIGFAAPVVICGLITVFVQERGLLSRLLLTKPLQAMADLSFAIYMVHALVLMLVLACFHAYGRFTGQDLFVTTPNLLAGLPGAPTTIQVLHVGGIVAKGTIMVAYVAVVLVAAYATHRLVEVPGRAFFGALAKRLNGIPSRQGARTHSRVEPRAPAS